MTENLKKYYTAPEVDSIKLDKGIALILLSSPPPDPTSAAPVEPEKPSFGPSSAPPSSANNPFGGDKPDYSDM